MSLLARLASLKLTWPAMTALLVGVLVTYRGGAASALWLAVPLSVLAANLLAALVVNPLFRRHAGLLVFHVCLLVVVLLALGGHLTGLSARVEIAQGQGFEPGAVTVVREGPWHAGRRLGSLDFEQGPLRVEYLPGLVRLRTESRVRVGDRWLSFGDNVPLVLDGYRFYTTSNKGHAAIVTWQGRDGERLHGAIHFPSFPRHDWKQVNHWTTPGGKTLDLELLLPAKAPLDTAWALGDEAPRGTLQVDTGDTIARLPPGGSVRVAGGTLHFEDLRLWMGYQIYHHPLLEWLLAAALVGVGGMGWHFWAKLGPRPGVSPAPAVKEGNGDGVRSGA